MRHLVSATISAAAIALVLTGCSSGPEPDDGSGPFQPRATSAVPASESTAGDEPTRRTGYRTMQLGDTAEFSVRSHGSGGMTWTIERIEVDPACSAHTRPGRHLLILHVRIHTGDDKDTVEEIPTAFGYQAFAEPNDSGGTSKAQASGCKSTEPGSKQLVPPYGKNADITGTVAVFVPHASGTLRQDDPLVSGKGWDWSYPAS